MIQNIFAWILVTLVIVGAYPWAYWLLNKSQQPAPTWLTFLLTLALSTGILTLLMFWESVLGIPFTLWGITLPYLALVLIGVWLWRRDAFNKHSPAQLPADANPLPRRVKVVIAVMLAVISAAILFNGAYWPFHRDDTLGIYHRYGKLMYETGGLVPFAGRDDAFYQAYPMHIPLAYSYAYLAADWVNEYLAKTVTTLLSLACLPAAYGLGRVLFNERVGWLSALLFALMPTFGRWASSGYVDLPMAFLYTLSAVFAWRLWQGGARVDALLAGVVMGLAAWTKNAALIGVGILVIWLLYAWVKRQIRLQHAVIALAGCAVVAAPWYTRNYLEARLIVPPTAWTDQAQRTLQSLLIFITQPENFALTGWVIISGVIASLIYIFRQRLNSPADNLLLLWTIPFFAFWWVFASYDPRFVLLFLPFLCVIGGRWVVQLWDWLPTIWQGRLKLPLLAVTLALAVYVAWISVEYKDDILRSPLMDDTAKHEIVLSGP